MNAEPRDLQPPRSAASAQTGEMGSRRRRPAWLSGFPGNEATGATGLEPATPGFGDRCATNCATPLGCGADCIGGVRSSIARVPLAVLFGVITVVFAGIAVASALAGEWPIAVAAAALALWIGPLAYSALRRSRS